MDIKDYWNERATKDASNATTNDVCMRSLERVTLVEQLRRLGCTIESRVLDAGCGDGETLVALDDAFGCVIFGRDYSASMLDLARKRVSERPRSRFNVALGDVRSLRSEFADESFDFISTDRCLINLESEEQQFSAIAGIAGLLRPGGFYLAIENFVEGNDRLNELRRTFELPPIEIRWHNRFFTEKTFIPRMKEHFSFIEKVEFCSAYYLATRVIYSKLCAVEGRSPDYRHPIHELSTKLPLFGDFSPIKLFVLGK